MSGTIFVSKGVPLLLISLLLLCAPHTLADEPVTAELFAAGGISDEHWQWRLTFSPDGTTAYFSHSEGWFPRTRQATIMRSRLGPDDRWSVPVPAPFSGTYSDMDPFITPDGQRLYFSSSRQTDGREREVFDLWYVDKLDDGWSEPVRLGKEINTDQDELYVSATDDGTLYFASGPTAPGTEASWNIYRARPDGGGFAPRQAVDAVNSPPRNSQDSPVADWDFNPEISPDGRMLFFTSLRPGGKGLGDIYVSINEAGTWSPPHNLGPSINTGDDEFHPTLSRDGRVLYFVRARFEPELIPGNFYRIPLQALDLPEAARTDPGDGVDTDP